MGTNNKQRRAAKARDRRRAQNRRDARTPRPGPDGYDFGAAEFLLGQHLRHRHLGGTSTIALEQFCATPLPEQQRVVDGETSAVVDQLFEVGWTPHDLHEVARRTVPVAPLAHLVDVMSQVTARHPQSSVHPAWREQLDSLHPSGHGSPSAAAWAQRHGLGWPEAVAALVDLLFLLGSLPIVEPVLPRPGARLSGRPAAGPGIDEKVLRRVRALLAKAESTDFEEEADALTAKAQRLMTEHSIDRALAEAGGPVVRAPVVRRVWLESPYVMAKSLLVQSVADANQCRSVLSERWGFVTLLGHERDLDFVELLSTSLLVQATRAMTSAGSHRTRSGQSRTRSFRQSFLVAYAGRIGERLRESADDTATSADQARHGAVLPVLASRRRRVDEQCESIFPNLFEHGVSVSNAAGYGAGRAAADLALFEVRDVLPQSAGVG